MKQENISPGAEDLEAKIDMFCRTSKDLLENIQTRCERKSASKASLRSIEEYSFMAEEDEEYY